MDMEDIVGRGFYLTSKYSICRHQFFFRNPVIGFSIACNYCVKIARIDKKRAALEKATHEFKVNCQFFHGEMISNFLKADCPNKGRRSQDVADEAAGKLISIGVNVYERCAVPRAGGLVTI